MATNRFPPDAPGVATPLTDADRSLLLSQGEVVSCVLAPMGSNYTFLTKIQGDDGAEISAVYKPMKGEIPLWDFEPGTLYKRECAAYLLSELLGWNFIPETVIRDGPYGVGSMQLFVDHDPRITYRELKDTRRGELKTIACFDIVANNADRKAMHCILGADDRVWGIDHGLTFNESLKMRTVIWDFWGEELDDWHIQPLKLLASGLASQDKRFDELTSLLRPGEREALAARTNWLLEQGAFPRIGTG